MSPANAATERMPVGGAAKVHDAPAAQPETAVRVKVEPLVGSQSKPRKRYWMGTFKSCPLQNVTAGGHVFQRFSGNPVLDANGEPETEPAPGTYNMLTEEQVKTVCAGVALRVIRKVGTDGRRGIILMRDTASYRPEPGDEPLAKHVYMSAAERSETLPPPMLEE